jgi:hypothetical protein
MQKLPHQHFRLGILAPYTAHIIAAGFLAVHIGHGAKLAVFGRRGQLVRPLIPRVRGGGIHDGPLLKLVPVNPGLGDASHLLGFGSIK